MTTTLLIGVISLLLILQHYERKELYTRLNGVKEVVPNQLPPRKKKGLFYIKNAYKKPKE